MTTNKYLEIQDNQKLSSYVVTEATHQEKKHLIVPVVMIVEGVLNGSHGPLLHLADDFGKIPESWNGIPVVIQHPEQDGKSISANSPAVIDSVMVGRIYNAKVDNNRLLAEAWLEEAKLNAISKETLTAVNNANTIEVSVGVYTEDEETAGEWNGIKYNAIARNHRPDHLALLPGGVGACSLTDGCGLGVNSSNTNENLDVNPIDVEIVDNLEINLKEEVQIMSEEVKKCTPCIEKKATELIANKATKFTEAHRGWLETFEETQLDLMIPEVTTIEVEKLVNNALSDEDQKALDYGKQMLKEKKDTMAASIQKNCAAGTWDDAELQTMSETMLEKLYKSTMREEPPVDFSLNGNARQVPFNRGTATVTPLLPNV